MQRNTTDRSFLCRSFGLLFALMVLLMAPPASSKLGGQDASGGNPYEGEFRLIGLRLLDEIAASGLTSEQLGFQIPMLANAVKTIRPFGSDNPTSEMTINKSWSRPGLNYKSSRGIIFNNDFWKGLNSEQKRIFVLHEYLRFTHDLNNRPLDDSSLYDFSSDVLRRLKTSTQNLSEPQVLCFMWVTSLRPLVATWSSPNLYMADGFDDLEVRKTVRQKCFEKEDQGITTCGSDRAEIKCSSPSAGTPPEKWACQAHPYYWGQVAQGRGNTLISAQIRTFTDCQEKGMLSSCRARYFRNEMGCRKLLPDEQF